MRNTTLTSHTIEHRGDFPRPAFNPLAGVVSSKECGKVLTSHGHDTVSFEDVMNHRNKNWRMLWDNKKAYRAMTPYLDNGPLQAGNNRNLDVDYVNEYVSKSLQGIKPLSMRIPRKYRQQAERIIKFVDSYQEPLKEEKSYWATESVPAEFAGKGVGDTVVPLNLVRVNTDPSRIHDYMSVGMSYKHYNNEAGDHGYYPDGCLVVIRDASGFPSRFDWQSTEYLLPAGCTLLIEDMYKADIARGFETYKDFTVFEVRMMSAR